MHREENKIQGDAEGNDEYDDNFNDGTSSRKIHNFRERHHTTNRSLLELGTNWYLFVRLIQMTWNTGTIARHMMWVAMVLLPKGGGDFRGIGMLKPF